MRRPPILTGRPDDHGKTSRPAFAVRRRPAALRVAAVVASGAVVLVLAGACGDDGTTTYTSTTSPPPLSTSAPSTPPGSSTTSTSTSAATTVMVTETEFAIKLSQDTFTPGTYTFVTKNAGSATHALEIEGPGLDEAKTANLGSGKSQDLTVTLRPGTYKLYCPVGNHEAQGMKLEITVA